MNYSVCSVASNACRNLGYALALLQERFGKKAYVALCIEEPWGRKCITNSKDSQNEGTDV